MENPDDLLKELWECLVAQHLLEDSLYYEHPGKQYYRLTRDKLERIKMILLSKEYADWRDDDSPKGETVPGVRYGGTRW